MKVKTSRSGAANIRVVTSATNTVAARYAHLAHLLDGALRVVVDWSSARSGLRVGVVVADPLAASGERMIPAPITETKAVKRRGEEREVGLCPFRNLLHVVLWVKEYAAPDVPVYVERGWENKSSMEHDRCVLAAGYLPGAATNRVATSATTMGAAQAERRLREFDPLRTKNARGFRKKTDDADLEYIAEATRDDVRENEASGRHRVVSYNARLTTDTGGLHPDVLALIALIIREQGDKYKGAAGLRARAWLKAQGFKNPKVLMIQTAIAREVLRTRSGVLLWLRAKGPTRALIERDGLRGIKDAADRRVERARILDEHVWSVIPEFRPRRRQLPRGEVRHQRGRGTGPEQDPDMADFRPGAAKTRVVKPATNDVAARA